MLSSDFITFIMYIKRKHFLTVQDILVKRFSQPHKIKMKIHLYDFNMDKITQEILNKDYASHIIVMYEITIQY